MWGTYVTEVSVAQAMAALVWGDLDREAQAFGLAVLGGDLAGKAISLPEAECPVRGSERLSGTVTVYTIVAKNGQVYKARGLGGDWLMRGCATEAAMKSTFDPEKLTARETEGTITYTFTP